MDFGIEVAEDPVDYNRIAEVVRAVMQEQQAPPLRVGTKELMKRLGISRMMLWRMMKQHRIPFERHGRKLFFDVASVDTALKRFRVRSAGD